MKKRCLFIFLLAFLCIGQGFGPKIIKGPTPAMISGSISNLPTGIPGMYVWWSSKDLSIGDTATNWVDRVQGKIWGQNTHRYRNTNSPWGLFFNGTEFTSYSTYSNPLPWRTYYTNSGGFGISNGTTTHLVIYNKPTIGLSVDSLLSQMNPYYGMYKQISLLYNSGQGGGPGVFVSAITTNSLYSITIVCTNASKASVYTNGIYDAGADGWYAPIRWDAVGADTNVTYFTDDQYNYRGYIAEIIQYTNILNYTQISNLYCFSSNMYSMVSPLPPKEVYEFGNGGPFVWLCTDTNMFGVMTEYYDVHTNTTPILYWINQTRNVSFKNQAGAGNAGKWSSSKSTPSGLPSIDFNYVGFSYLNTDGGQSLVLSHPSVCFAVVKIESQADTSAIFGSTTGVRLNVSPTAGVGELYCGTSLSLPAFLSSDWVVWSWCYSTNKSWVRTNGVLYALGDAGTTVPGQGVIGSNDGSPPRLLGQMAEFIVYKGGMSTNDIQGVEAMLKRKHAIP